MVQPSWPQRIYNPITAHTGYIEVFMQGKCGRNTETTFDIKWVIGTYGNWKNQNPGGRPIQPIYLKKWAEWAELAVLFGW